MLASKDVNGVIAAIVTPFDESGRVSPSGLETIVEYVVSGGVHAIMTTGGTGEFPNLLRDERMQVTGLVVKQVSGRIPVIAGTASCSTLETLVLNRFLEYGPGYVAPAKEALTMMGFPAGPVRRPLPDLTEEERRGVRQALIDLELLKG